MNIKELIGKRIQTARKAKGLTQVELAKLAGELKQPRINNWERGIRTPGLQEIRQLATVLDVSLGYLMCLDEHPQMYPSDRNNIGALIPFLNYEQASNPKESIKNIKEKGYDVEVPFIPIEPNLAEIAGDFAFAVRMNDESMEPELRKNDLLIVCPDFKLKPGNLVLAQIVDNSEIIIRHYKLLSITRTTQNYELLATNKHWPDLQADNCKLLGSIIYLHRALATI